MVAEIVRLAILILASYTTGQTFVIAVKQRPMPVGQVVRFLALGWLLGTLAAFQALHWDRPVTAWTLSNLVAVSLAALGVRLMPRP